MNTRRLLGAALAALLALGVSTSALADRRTENTLIGAGLGGIAGALLSDSDPLITLGGAAAGGVLGNILTEDERKYRDRRHWKKNKGPKHFYQRTSYRGHPKYHANGHWKHKHKHRGR